MQTIRPKAFETNSSSTHSIVVAKSGKEIITETKGLEIKQGEFGWEWAKYTDTYSKASYLYTALSDANDEHYKKAYPKEYELNKTLSKVWNSVSKKLGLVLIPPGEKDWTYVDHGMEHARAMTYLHTEEGMTKFITSSKYCLITGNDNQYNPPNHEMYPGEEKALPLVVTLKNQLIVKTAYADHDNVEDTVFALAGKYIEEHTRRADDWVVNKLTIRKNTITIERMNWSSLNAEPLDSLTLTYTVDVNS